MNDTSIFAPIDILPAPSAVRSANGAPGPRYWQNRADYELAVTLDTVARLLQGTMTVRYTNHSPQTLTVLWLQTDRAASPLHASEGVPRTTDRTSFPGIGAGNTIDQFEQVIDGKQIPLTLVDHATIVEVLLARPLAPGQMATLTGRWHVQLWAQHGPVYEVTRWYPRLCVYDDVRGWNTDPWGHHPVTYLEYGDVTMRITVPASVLVAATGALQNPQAVLTPTERIRLAAAAHADTVVHIVTAAELANGTARPTHTGMVTWTFQASMVNDVAWAVSSDYQWDASGWRGILLQTYYRPTQAVEWAPVIAQLRASLQEYATRLSPYPYPQLSAAGGGPIVSGSFAMLVLSGDDPTPLGFFRNITQTVDQTWFPMLLGSNEHRHAWLDGGLSQFLSTFGEARYYAPRGQRTILAPYISFLEGTAEAFNVPVDVPAEQFEDEVYGYSQFLKPTVALQILREEILGPVVFDGALRTYALRWAFKHPTSADFFRTMNAVSGHQLDWFWREWFLEPVRFDQGIEMVRIHNDGPTEHLVVQYSNQARGVLPLLVRFTFADGTTHDWVYPADVWQTNRHTYVQDYTVAKHVTRIELDPEHHLVDLDRSNNTWVAP